MDGPHPFTSRTVLVVVVCAVVAAPVVATSGVLSQAGGSAGDGVGGSMAVAANLDDVQTAPAAADAVQEGSETEPNDDGANANPLEPGVPIEGTVSTEEDWDFFTVDVPSSGQVEITVGRSPGGGTLAVGVYDPAGNFVTGRFTGDGQTGFVVDATQSGTYYVLVASGSQFVTEDGSPGPSGTGPYTLQVTLGGAGPSPTPGAGNETSTADGFDTPTQTPGGFETPTPGDFETPTPTPGGFETPATTPTTNETVESEPNDAPGQANAVQFGGVLAGEIESAEDRDWFVFDATADETINATLQRTGGNGTFRVLYYYSNGTIYADFTSIEPDGQATLVAVPPISGQYYVRIASPDGFGSYTFSVAPVESGREGVIGPGGAIDPPGGNETTTPQSPTETPGGTATEESE